MNAYTATMSEVCSPSMKGWGSIGEKGKHEWRTVVDEKLVYDWCLKCNTTKETGK